MEYIKLISGIVFIAIFTWVLMRNRNRSGFIHTLFRFDTLAGIVAGLYMIVTSVYALLVP